MFIIYKGLITHLPVDCRAITALKLGVYDGIVYNVKDIANIFCISELEVEEKLNKGINMLHELVKDYEKEENSRRIK